MEDTEAAANVDARSSDADSWSFETNEKQDLEDLSVTLCERQARNPVALKEDRNSSQQQMRRRRLLAAEEITNWLENKENNDLLLNEEVSVMMSAGVSDSSVSQRGGEHLWDELRSVSPSSVKDSMPSLLIHGSRTSKDFCAASVLAGQTFAEYQMLFHDLLRMDVLSAVDFQTMIHDTSDKVATVLQSIIGLWIEILNGKNLKPLINACWFTQGVYGADAVYVIQDTESCGIIALECQHFLHPQQIFDKNAWPKFKQEEALTMIKKGVDNLKYNGIIFNESFNVEATEEVFMSSLDRQLMECIWKLNKYHKTQLQALRGMKCFSSSLSKKWSRKFPQMQDIKCICHGPGRHRITCGCMDEKFIHLALQDFSYTLLCVESYDPTSYIDAMKSFVQHQKLNIEKLEEGFCEFYSLRESDSVRHPSSVEGMGLPGSPGMAYSVKAICPLHTVAYRLECMDVAERAIKHFRTVGFSGSTVFADVQYPHYAHAQIDPVQRWLKLQLNIVQQQFGFLQKRHVADTAKLSGILTRCGLPSWLFLQSKGQSEQQENTTTAAKVNQVFFDEPKQTLPRVKEKELQRKNLLKSKSLAHQSQEDGTTTHKPRSTSGKCYKCGSRNHKSPFHRNCPYYGKQ